MQCVVVKIASAFFCCYFSCAMCMFNKSEFHQVLLLLFLPCNVYTCSSLSVKSSAKVNFPKCMLIPVCTDTRGLLDQTQGTRKNASFRLIPI